MYEKLQRDWIRRPCDALLLEDFRRSGSVTVESVLYAQRGIGPDDAGSFSYPVLAADLSNPFSIEGMSDAASVIGKTVRELGTVAVIGDYDVDGIMASTIVQKMLAEMGCRHCDIFLPSRQHEGYGLNDKTVSSFIKKYRPPNLLIVVDTGAAYGKQRGDLRKLGVGRIVVLDHHIPGSQGHPATAVDAYVNWRKSGNDPYCAAGEAYQLARACSTICGFESEWLASFAAVATVADVVPLRGDNRVIVKCGLPELWNSRSAGLISLVMNSTYSGGFYQNDVAFQVAPRINAAGRIGDPDRALRLMLSSDVTECMALVSELDAVNSERKLVEAKMEKAVRKMAIQEAWQNGIVCYDPSWIPGVCGLVASTIAEEFGVPCLVFGQHDGKITGSGRSVKGANIKEIMDRCQQIFVRYGGHEMACGAQLDPEFLPRCAELFDTACGDYYREKGRLTHEAFYDFELTPQALTPEFGFRILNLFHPYHDDGNPEPVFKLSNVTLGGIETKESDEWKRTSVTLSACFGKPNFEFSTFSRIDVPGLVGRPIDIYFKFPQTENEEKITDLELIDAVPVDAVKKE